MPKCVLQMFRVSQSLDRQYFYAEIMGQYVKSIEFLAIGDRFDEILEIAQKLSISLAMSRHTGVKDDLIEAQLAPTVVNLVKLCFYEDLNNQEIKDKIKATGPHEMGLDEVVNMIRFMLIDQYLLGMERYRDDPLNPDNDSSSKEYLAVLHKMQETWLELINCPGICTECYIRDEIERKRYIGDPVDEYSRFIQFPDTIQ